MSQTLFMGHLAESGSALDFNTPADDGCNRKLAS